MGTRSLEWMSIFEVDKHLASRALVAPPPRIEIIARAHFCVGSCRRRQQHLRWVRSSEVTPGGERLGAENLQQSEVLGVA